MSKIQGKQIAEQTITHNLKSRVSGDIIVETKATCTFMKAALAATVDSLTVTADAANL